MWKCPKCETQNNSSFCAICGEQKPIQQNSVQEQQSIAPQRVEVQNATVFNEATPVAKKPTALIVVCIILALLLICAIAVSVIVITNVINRDDAPAQVEVHSATIKKETADAQDKEVIEQDVEEEAEPEDDENAQGKTINTIAEDSEGNEYMIYQNSKYGFYCAYPAHFDEITVTGVNALKTFESPDGSASMTIRACRDQNGITIEDAMEDFYSACGGYVSYEASGDTWYAASIEIGERSLYRKLFIENGNIYCMDFETDAEDVDFYGVYIEYIEDNFEVNK